jgi:hypothetical protein
MKTEQQLIRTELELRAIDSVYSELRYLGYRPKQDTWKAYCKAVNSKLSAAIDYAEYRQKHF